MSNALQVFSPSFVCVQVSGRSRRSVLRVAGVRVRRAMVCGSLCSMVLLASRTAIFPGSRLYLFRVAGVTERSRRLYEGRPLKCGRYEDRALRPEQMRREERFLASLGMTELPAPGV